MSTIVSRIRSRGVEHEPAAPTLHLDGVFVAYSAPRGQPMIGSPLGIGDERFALEDVSFDLDVGQQVAIVGPNGAGKSTLFKAVVGTIKPTRGTINIYGHDPGQHICIGYVPQRTQIDLSFPATVEDVVMMGRVGQIGLFRWPARRDWDAVHHQLERVKSGHLARKRIGELSGGQQQRVFIARALAQGADLLMLDEPFSGLDRPSYEAILSILDALRDDRVTVMVATHDLNLARERFEEVMLLNRRLIAFGQPERVLEPEKLLQAYGSSMHIVDESDRIIVADGCCEGDDEFDSS